MSGRRVLTGIGSCRITRPCQSVADTPHAQNHARMARVILQFFAKIADVQAEVVASRRPLNSPNLRHQLSVRSCVTVRSKQGQKEPMLGGREGMHAVGPLDDATRQIERRPIKFNVIR